MSQSCPRLVPVASCGGAYTGVRYREGIQSQRWESRSGRGGRGACTLGTCGLTGASLDTVRGHRRRLSVPRRAGRAAWERATAQSHSDFAALSEGRFRAPDGLFAPGRAPCLPPSHQPSVDQQRLHTVPDTLAPAGLRGRERSAATGNFCLPSQQTSSSTSPRCIIPRPSSTLRRHDSTPHPALDHRNPLQFAPTSTRRIDINAAERTNRPPSAAGPRPRHRRPRRQLSSPHCCSCVFQPSTATNSAQRPRRSQIPTNSRGLSRRRSHPGCSRTQGLRQSF